VAGEEVDRSGVTEDARRALGRDLASAVRGEVRFDAATRALYSADASNYRQVPLGVVWPLDEADCAAALATCARHGAPVLARGAGTSLAGQACNVAVVIDTSRHLDQILEIDPEARLARVQPGVVLDRLNEAARPLGLTFGPDPATHAWCTLGGMVANNSCGTHALYAGKTVDNVEALTALTYRGARLELGALDEGELARRAGLDGEAGRVYDALRALRDSHGAAMSTGYPDLARRVSGYSLDQLVGPRPHLARALVGSESTLALFTEVTLRLVPWPGHRVLVVLGYRDIYAAADDVPRLLEHRPIGLEGFDVTLTDQMRRARLHTAQLSLLPPGGGWLLVEIGDDDEAHARTRAAALCESLPPEVASAVMEDEASQQAIWQVRESGLGATARPPGRAPNYEGWEDAAVPPERLGEYLRSLRALWEEFGYSGAWYGHFGQGCVHTRNDFDLASEAGLARFRAYVERAADLVVSLGGSISGEHGDGQARGELLSRMYGPDLMAAFADMKAAFDPDGRMNPGKLVDPYPLDTNLRDGPTKARTRLGGLAYRYPDDPEGLQGALERCVGVGRCRSEGAGTMCPSYRATHDERHSTRGRARIMDEMLRGQVLADTWKSEAVAEALELCLSCKGCASDCPTHVDMATYKSEFNSHHYRRRRRPRVHFAFGLLPWLGRVASRAPRLANAALSSARLGRGLRHLGGVADRPAPAFAPAPFRRRPEARLRHARTDATVTLLPDTFSDLFWPERAAATLRVLEASGERVAVVTEPVCCGRTLYDPGMLDLARASARRLLRVLSPDLEAGRAIVVPEPSCLAAMRDEIPRLLDDPRAARLAELARSLSEHLVEHPGALAGVALGDAQSVTVHPHCHEAATTSRPSDHELLASLGFAPRATGAGCCGLAGSFGFDARHQALSRTIAEDRFAPALRAAAGEVVIDGFSCRVQGDQVAGRASRSLAELLDERIARGKGTS
jgi:FAD/FMN-containing dehydrogenase/Fe-S oxidoreductase